MTQLLEQALVKLLQLPESEQDAIASIILDELADEQRWQASFAASQDQLAKLAAKVRADV
jgi:aspartate/glutamate racemase